MRCTCRIKGRKTTRASLKDFDFNNVKMDTLNSTLKADVPKDECSTQSDEDGCQILGEHETQVLEDSEADLDLHKHYAGCTKNPGHEQFIPVDKFTIQHLPEDRRDEDLVQLIKNTADLTVRVDVKVTSSCRPQYWPNKTRPYPFHKGKKTNLRLGSGIIWNVHMVQDETAACWCKQCQQSNSPKHVWWEFYVDTATHVVFDDEEAKHTSLTLFYDREGSPEVTVDTVRVDKVDIEYDVCMLKGVTCNRRLGRKLVHIGKDFSESWQKVCDEYKTSRDDHKLVYIVSHPHGCHKQVSIGRWRKKYVTKDKDGNDLYQFTYTTCTCPGSSGANVQCVGYSVDWPDLVHGGCLRSGLNYSGNCKAF
ncbi:uncharacterized protein LOC106070937 isoform X1 [Biomphalaria glabrata]|uniref:Uncharacterized protein LOC106070937 isoform X1 n=2 Tax=Biomphalaria glabrata TaxID=6526 RepID=A0A9U8EGH6_BIOGL|nr:uncharacterized protein LOC106070937 isoform X1 [Biomphalaria glabrata]